MKSCIIYQMNLFFLDIDPKLCAKYHCDAHCVKMILEACQLMWAAFHITGEKDWESTVPDGIKVYLLTHKNHPTAIWVRSSVNNFQWTASLAKELCIEYTQRYNRRHACEDMIDWFLLHHPNCNEETKAKATTFYCTSNIPEGCTPPPLAMPHYYHEDDLVLSYRNYYIYDKEPIAQWKYCDTPGWFY
jgi:hypothetical protein